MSFQSAMSITTTSHVITSYSLLVSVSLVDKCVKIINLTLLWLVFLVVMPTSLAAKILWRLSINTKNVIVVDESTYHRLDLHVWRKRAKLTCLGFSNMFRKCNRYLCYELNVVSQITSLKTIILVGNLL